MMDAVERDPRRFPLGRRNEDERLLGCSPTATVKQEERHSTGGVVLDRRRVAGGELRPELRGAERRGGRSNSG